jgi:hypothetical protein
MFWIAYYCEIEIGDIHLAHSHSKLRQMSNSDNQIMMANYFVSNQTVQTPLTANASQHASALRATIAPLPSSSITKETTLVSAGGLKQDSQTTTHTTLSSEQAIILPSQNATSNITAAKPPIKPPSRPSLKPTNLLGVLPKGKIKQGSQATMAAPDPSRSKGQPDELLEASLPREFLQTTSSPIAHFIPPPTSTEPKTVLPDSTKISSLNRKMPLPFSTTPPHISSPPKTHSVVSPTPPPISKPVPLPSTKLSPIPIPTTAFTNTAKPAQVTAPTPSLPLQLKRLSAPQILAYYKNHSLQYEQIPFVLPPPPIDDFDMVAVYSLDLLSKLRNMLITRDVTLFVNAGSSLAGAGQVISTDRSHRIFAQSFYNVTIVDRAHGARNTFHSMQLMHSYFPVHADIILWEFAINDALEGGRDDASKAQNQRNQLILYLEQVARVARERQQEPPLVILVYLWDMPFGMSTGKIKQRTFHSHRHLAERFDFVVGHVNGAKYVDSLGLAEAQAKAFVIADGHHPNSRGHMILAYLLNDFVMNEQRLAKPKEVVNQTLSSYIWDCGEDTTPRKLLKNLLAKRHPVASYTEELLKNDELLRGMLRPNVTAPRVHCGKIDPIRRDRQYCSVLPCCNKANYTFDVARYSPLQGMQVHLSPDRRGASVLFNDKNVTNSLFSAKGWGCIFDSGFDFLYDWFVLEQEEPVSRISFCNHLPTCGAKVEPPSNSLCLMSFAVYGGKRDTL